MREASAIIVGLLCGVAVPFMPNRTMLGKFAVAVVCLVIMEVSYYAGRAGW